MAVTAVLLGESEAPSKMMVKGGGSPFEAIVTVAMSGATWTCPSPVTAITGPASSAKAGPASRAATAKLFRIRMKTSSCAPRTRYQTHVASYSLAVLLPMRDFLL